MTRPLGFLSIIILQLGLMVIGLKIHLLLMVAVPLIVIISWWLIKNPGICLLLLSLTAVIKGFLIQQFQFMEIFDFTLIMTTLTWLGLTKMFINGQLSLPKRVQPMLSLFTGFTILLIFSGFYTPSPEYGLLKILRFVTISFTMFVGPLLVIKTSKDSAQLIKIYKIIIVSVALVLVGQLAYLFVSGGLFGFLVRVSFQGANPIAIARYLSLGAALTIVILINRPLHMRIFLIIGLLLILLGMIATGSRGPMVSLFLGVITYIFFFESRYRSRLLIYAGIALTAIIVLIFTLPESLTYRYLNISMSDVGITPTGVKRYSTIASRLDFWAMSLSAWIASLKNLFIGLGAGGFSSLFIWRDFQWYPHNLFLEVLAEMGLLGFGFITAFLISAWSIVIRNRVSGGLEEHTALWVVAALVLFFAAQVSGDINDNRVLWFFISLSVASVTADQQERSIA